MFFAYAGMVPGERRVARLVTKEQENLESFRTTEKSAGSFREVQRAQPRASTSETLNLLGIAVKQNWIRPRSLNL
jgi:hypothetical protein